MLDLKKIAITGGVASGKSTVCRFFQELGAFTVSADAIVHDLLANDPYLGQQIIQKFGPELVRNGEIDRALLAQKVFAHPEQLDWLEKQLHPMVLQKIEELYSSVSKMKGYSSFVVEVPLLFEANWAPFFDVTIGVVADEKTCLLRWENKGNSAASYGLRAQRLLSQEKKASLAHFAIHNNSSLEELHKQAESIYRRIIN
ncbi:MAG: dephospho-CoA kinase [Chlamydiia bacterium]|nr:dephospho-CoA kinase [Chlamydiia bacterium]